MSPARPWVPVASRGRAASGTHRRGASSSPLALRAAKGGPVPPPAPAQNGRQRYLGWARDGDSHHPTPRPTSPPGVTPWRGPWGAGDTKTFGMHSGSRWGPERSHPAASSTKTRLRARRRGNETPLNAPRCPPKDLSVPRLGPVSCTHRQPPGFQQATLAPMQCWCPCNTPVQCLHPCNIGTHAALVPMQCSRATLAPHATPVPMQRWHPRNTCTLATLVPMQHAYAVLAPMQHHCPCSAGTLAMHPCNPSARATRPHNANTHAVTVLMQHQCPCSAGTRRTPCNTRP